MAVLGGFLPRGFVLARHDALAIAVNRLVAYPTGFSIGLIAVTRPGGFLPSNPSHPALREPASQDDFRFAPLLGDGMKLVAELGARLR